MLIGAMNHPQRDPVKEIETFAAMGLSFIDLTLEPPAAAPWLIDKNKTLEALKRHRLGIVGHTAYYLPIAHPFQEVRRAAVTVLEQCLHVFAGLGVSWMNIHPDARTPFHDRTFLVDRNVESLGRLVEIGKKMDIGIMVENTPGDFNNAEQLGQLLDPLPELGLHLDIGHTNLLVTENPIDQIMHRFGDRLRHVHLHDNKGGAADLHLPLGTGNLDLQRCLKALKKTGYDDTITLEVFSPDPSYLLMSAEKLRTLWQAL